MRRQPGETLMLRGIMVARAFVRTRAGVVTCRGFPDRLSGNSVDILRVRLRGNNLLVRGDMGTRAKLALPIGNDGLVRFRLGLTLK